MKINTFLSNNIKFSEKWGKLWGKLENKKALNRLKSRA